MKAADPKDDFQSFLGMHQVQASQAQSQALGLDLAGLEFGLKSLTASTEDVYTI